MTVAEDHAGGQFVNIGPEEFRPALSVAEDSSACAPAACQTSDVRLETEVSELFSSPSSSPTPPPAVLSSPCSPLSHPTSPLSSRASSPPEVVDSIEERWPDLLASDGEVDAPVGGETVFAAQQPPASALLLLALLMDISAHCWWTPDLPSPSCRSGCHSRDGIGPGQFHCG